MKKHLLGLSITLLFTLVFSNMKASTYSQTLPDVQSANGNIYFTFTNTTAASGNGSFSFGWLACWQASFGPSQVWVYLFTSTGYEEVYYTTSNIECVYAGVNVFLSMAEINDAIAANGGSSVLIRMNISDGCQPGVGCSFYNDPIIYTPTLSYTYSAADFIGSPLAVCLGGSVSFTDQTPLSVTSWSWSFPGGSPSSSTLQNPTIIYNSAGTYSVTLSATHAGGTDITTKTNYIAVNSNPAATITSNGSTSICTGSSVQLNANVGGGLLYQWRKNSVDISGATSSFYFANQAGDYDCRITNANTCQSVSNTLTVTVHSKPSAIITAGGATEFCSGGSVTLNVVPVANCTYQWKKGAQNLSGATNTAYAATVSGIFKCIVTNQYGCSRTSNGIQVTVTSPTASITAQGSTSLCDGENLVLQANTGIGLLYQWKLNNVDIAGATSSSYVASQTGQFRCRVTNQCGAKNSNIITVTVNPNPTGNISAAGNTTFCNGGSVMLNENSGGGLTYQWHRNGSPLNGATNSNHEATQAGDYTVVVVNTYNCDALSNSIAVTVNSLPTATITPQGPTSFCAGGSVELLANAGANLTYQWTKNNVNINGATNISYVATLAGNYKVIVTNTSTGCIKTSAATSVTVPCRLSGEGVGADMTVELIPNPFYDAANLKVESLSEEALHIRIFSSAGILLEEYIMEPGREFVTIGEQLPEGFYLAEVKQGPFRKLLKFSKINR